MQTPKDIEAARQLIADHEAEQAAAAKAAAEAAAVEAERVEQRRRTWAEHYLKHLDGHERVQTAAAIREARKQLQEALTASPVFTALLNYQQAMANSDKASARYMLARAAAPHGQTLPIRSERDSSVIGWLNGMANLNDLARILDQTLEAHTDRDVSTELDAMLEAPDGDNDPLTSYIESDPAA